MSFEKLFSVGSWPRASGLRRRTDVALSLRDRKALCLTDIVPANNLQVPIRVTLACACPVAEQQGYFAASSRHNFTRFQQARSVDAVDWTKPEFLYAAAAVVTGLLLIAIVAMIVWRLRRRPAAQPTPDTDLSIHVARLPLGGPQESGPRLECYGVPVRLAVVVVAPVGRAGAVPAQEQWPKLFECLLPGLIDVIGADQPLIRFWPAQLSSQGFTHTFFHRVALPGDHGQNTPWCSVAGKFNFAGQSFLAGLVCCAAGPNGLSPIVVQQGMWLDVLRVRR